MRFFRKKNKKRQEGRAGVYTRKSLPVDRYYSPSNRREFSENIKNKNERLRRLNEPSTKRSSKANTSIFSRFLQLLGYGGIIAILLINGWLGSVGLKVRTSNSNDIAYRDGQSYQKIIHEVFGSSLLYRSKVSFNSQNFEKKVVKRLPEVQKATAVIPLVGTKLQVGLELSHPLLRLEIDQWSQGVVGNEGVFVFQDSLPAIIKEFAELPLLKVEPAFSASVGESVLTDEEVLLVQLLLHEFDGSEDLARHPVTAITFNIEKRELNVRFKSVPYYAKLTSERDTRTQIGSLVASLRDLRARGNLPTKYIDVRVEGRVFVL